MSRHIVPFRVGRQLNGQFSLTWVGSNQVSLAPDVVGLSGMDFIHPRTIRRFVSVSFFSKPFPAKAIRTGFRRAQILFCAALSMMMSASGAAAEEVVLQLRWDHQFQIAGYYAVPGQGYHAGKGTVSGNDS